MLREAIPEKDWTPAQREQMRGWERLWSRDRQWLRVGNWKSRQIRTHDWVSLDAIADWCARKPGDIERDELRRRRAYLDLQHSIVHGEFSKGDRVQVVFLPPLPPSHALRLRLNENYIRAHTGTSLHSTLDMCWAPRELCLNWLEARGIAPPPWLLPNPTLLKAEPTQAPSTELTSPALPSLSRASDERIHSAISAVYEAAVGKKPPNIKELVPLVLQQLKSTRETATWQRIQDCASDERYKGKRRPLGRTLKSEQARKDSRAG
jgi:hypothetical protein